VPGFVRVTLIVFLATMALLGGLALFSAFCVRSIEQAHPPAGRFVEVAGGRIHLVELGPAAAAPVVLLHGASGNLEDMRLALGDKLAKHHRVILVDRPGHGWSSRLGGSADASPARQAALIHEALKQIGIRRAVIVGHSWSGALATAYALAYPDAVSGLLLLAPVTHPWTGGVGWYNPILTTPIIGPLFARTIALPIGKLLTGPVVTSVFAPHEPPQDYAERTVVELVLRPAELIANAEDLTGLKPFVSAQAPNYGAIAAPVTIMTGDLDYVVSQQIHAEAIAAVLPRGRLIVLPGVGHMIHHVAADAVVEAIAGLAQQDAGRPAN
jgi:pimeloyl-ACP methyl ester carboxylesterase